MRLVYRILGERKNSSCDGSLPYPRNMASFPRVDLFDIADDWRLEVPKAPRKCVQLPGSGESISRAGHFCQPRRKNLHSQLTTRVISHNFQKYNTMWPFYLDDHSLIDCAQCHLYSVRRRPWIIILLLMSVLNVKCFNYFNRSGRSVAWNVTMRLYLKLCSSDAYRHKKLLSHCVHCHYPDSYVIRRNGN